MLLTLYVYPCKCHPLFLSHTWTHACLAPVCVYTHALSHVYMLPLSLTHTIMVPFTHSEGLVCSFLLPLLPTCSMQGFIHRGLYACFFPLLYCTCRFDCHLSPDDFMSHISRSIRIHSPLEGPIETVSYRFSLNLRFPSSQNKFLPFNLMVYVKNTNFIPVTWVQNPCICYKSFWSSHMAFSLFLRYVKYSPTLGPLYLCSLLLESAFFMISKACFFPSFWFLQMLQLSTFPHPLRGKNTPVILFFFFKLCFNFLYSIANVICIIIIFLSH